MLSDGLVGFPYPSALPPSLNSVCLSAALVHSAECLQDPVLGLSIGPGSLLSTCYLPENAGLQLPLQTRKGKLREDPNPGLKMCTVCVLTIIVGDLDPEVADREDSRCAIKSTSRVTLSLENELR